MGSLEQPESLLSPGYRCYFNDGVAGYPTWLSASPPIEYTNGLTSNIPLLAVFAGTHPPAHIISRGGVSLRISSKIYPRSLFSLTPNMTVWHGIFQLLD
ncbi:hypothetical protein T02_11059 [Trichinella nativa]|uniref:Uncharacterized protein n=1 Tax=Trichinella nativa TaxID=6335 RepID=A0A0V1KJT6_9BILA|nr:hypothetical protein T02_11059 [Trichinella nativa]